MAHLGRAVGVHLDHVLRSLLHLQLDVVLPLEGGQSAVAGARARLALWRVRREGAL